MTFLFWDGFLNLIVFLQRYNFSTIDNDNPAANQKPLLGQWGQLGMVADLFKVQKQFRSVRKTFKLRERRMAFSWNAEPLTESNSATAYYLRFSLDG